MPLRTVETSNGNWQFETGRWLLRDERLYLLPGDSPMGLRLPLDSLPWSAPADIEPFLDVDPFVPRATLAPYRQLIQPTIRGLPADKESSRDGLVSPARPQSGTSAHQVVRTALCVEPRQGTLHVFLPPLAQLEAYLYLVAQVEQTAAELRVPVRLEGYPPPNDPRIQRLQLTPDPGVLEVNIHPARNWDQLISNTTIVYEQARLTRLGADKFMLDGGHTGTGGGHHLVLGGATPQDSPFLRRPDLLRSMLAFFNNHPALSYLFSGLFVGPTSQAPRVDEARHDSLYELEVAFRALDDCHDIAQPWLVDRLFRNLLVDVAGNTHRSEFCIDKFYSPDSILGRQGLLELRAFEMAPDPKMSLAQQLLVRALLARFWQQPYRRPLQRWGTALHDRFSLPHFIWQDLVDALCEINEAGFGLDPEWFRPHWEFRFARLGRNGAKAQVRRLCEEDDHCAAEVLSVRCSPDPLKVAPDHTEAAGSRRARELCIVSRDDNFRRE